MLNTLTARLRRFRDDADGYITLEAMIVMPALLWIFGASWVYFDVFRQQTVNQKANYTIGDMLSRETDPITDAYIDNTRELLYMLNKSQGTDTDLRITVVRSRNDQSAYEVVWSESRGQKPPLDNSDISLYADTLPLMASGDQVILVETWDDYSPVVAAGLDDFEIRTYSFTRPRFAPQMLWAGDSGNTWDEYVYSSGGCSQDCTNVDGSNNIEPSGGGA